MGSGRNESYEGYEGQEGVWNRRNGGRDESYEGHEGYKGQEGVPNRRNSGRDEGYEGYEGQKRFQNRRDGGRNESYEGYEGCEGQEGVRCTASACAELAALTKGKLLRSWSFMVQQGLFVHSLCVGHQTCIFWRP